MLFTLMEDIMDILRTLLFVPGNRERMLEKARTLAADGLILDLEDSVPPAEKDAARKMVAQAIPQLAAAGQEVYVRVNSLQTSYTKKDIEAVVITGLRGIVLPKSESRDDINLAATLIFEAEVETGIKPGSVRILPIIETPQGVINAYEIARASPRVAGINFGPEDFTREMGINHTKEGTEISYPRAVIAVACHAAGILAIDGVYMDARDITGLVKDAETARQIGYQGKMVVSPGQIEPVNQVFSPTADEVARAKRLIEAFNEAIQQGMGVTTVEGKIVDIPVAERAQKVLDLANEVEKRRKKG